MEENKSLLRSLDAEMQDRTGTKGMTHEKEAEDSGSRVPASLLRQAATSQGVKPNPHLIQILDSP